MSLAEFWEEISAVDRELLDAINRRVQLVRDLHAHKQEEGIPLRDLEREEQLVRSLQDANEGPLSTAGVSQFFHHVLELTRRELYGE